MLLKEIDSSSFDEFMNNSYKPHFMETSAWAEVSKTRNYHPHLVAMYDHDEIVMAALLLEKKVLNYSTYYCPRGFVCDFSNTALLTECLKALKEYVYNNHGLYLKFDPDLIIHKLDNDANIIETNDTHLSLIDFFKKQGLKHRGFTTQFRESSLPRHTIRINVDRSNDELLDSFKKDASRILRNNGKYGLTFYKGNRNDLEHFYKIMEDTAKRKKIYLEPKSYYENFYDILNTHNMSDIYVVKAEKNVLLKHYNDTLAKLHDDLQSNEKLLNKAKKENKRFELNKTIDKYEKELRIIQSINEEDIYLSSIITVKYHDMVWMIHGGNRDDLMFLNGNYEMFYNIMTTSRDEGYKWVDFFGIEGKVDKSSSIYGIYLFKTKFNGDYDEFIGEFDMINRPFINSIISKLLVLRRRIIAHNAIK